MKDFNRLLVALWGLLVVCSGCRENVPAEPLTAEINAIENGLLGPITVKGDTVKYMNILDQMDDYNVPGASVAVVENGVVKWAKGYGIANAETGTPVAVNTLFQAGSISKPVAALAVLKLLEEGRVDLDSDVNTYLKDWKVADNRFTQTEKVTLRRLLTHSAGMTVHGFPGYAQGDTFPSIISVLKGEGNTPAVFVDTIPGSIWRYSGGGYTVMEKVVEDVSGLPLEVYLAEHILPGFGMAESTYEQPLPEARQAQASAAYDNDGKLIEGGWHNYPEQAAAGLWTTPTDLAHYMITVQDILSGKRTDPLSKASVELMLTKHQNDWGLGPSLMWEADSLIFRHGGKNAGFTNEMIAFAHQGRGVIVMTNADNGGRLMGEIIRGISRHYGWGIGRQREVELVSLSEEQLKRLAGRYKLDFQVPDIGDYFIEISIKGDGLLVDDTNNGDTNRLSPLGEMEFIDLALGDRVVFEPSDADNGLTISWNGQYHFEKTD